jgi:hypothetical protein
MNDPLMPLSFTRTRSEAMALGLKLYFTGKPCKHGHLAERRCPSGSCVECDSGHQKSAVGRSGAIARAKQWRVQHPKQHGQHLRNGLIRIESQSVFSSKTIGSITARS